MLQDEVALLRASVETRGQQLEAIAACMQQQEAHVRLLQEITKAQHSAADGSKGSVPLRARDDIAAARKLMQEAQTRATSQLEAARCRRTAVLKDMALLVPQKKNTVEQCQKEKFDLDSELIRHRHEEYIERVKLEQQLSDMQRQLSVIEGEREGLKVHVVQLRDKLESALVVLEKQNKKLKRLEAS